MDTTDAKVALKYIIMAHGEQSVMMAGTSRTHMLYANSLDVDRHYQHMEMPILVKAQDPLCWMMFPALEMNSSYLSAITHLGKIITAAIMKMLVLPVKVCLATQ